jgi:hypothetical protein
MTDLEAFTGMLDRAGYKYTAEENSQSWFKQKGTGEIMAIHGTTNVEVDGVFYDLLYADFGENGQLLSISSHVAHCAGETEAIRQTNLPITKRGENP